MTPMQKLREAVAQGWTTRENKEKEMDSVLAEAISQKVAALVGIPEPEPAPKLVLIPVPQPEYRDWTPEEAIGKKVRSASYPDLDAAIITQCRGTGGALITDVGWVRLHELRQNWTQLDGSVCGVRVE